MSNITIILTTTAVVQEKSFLAQTDKQQRVDTYVKSTKQWLEKTTFNVVIVDNNGYSFPELEEYKSEYADRFEILYFVETDVLGAEHLKGDLHKGTSEIFAIEWAYYNSSIIPKSRFVIKITGRYFIPGFQEYLNQYDIENYDALRQNDTLRCEIVGAHIEKYHIIFNRWPVTEDFCYCGSTEFIYQYRIDKLCANKIHCKSFEIEPTPRGGYDETVFQL
jgi:hypothetical protein